MIILPQPWTRQPQVPVPLRSEYQTMLVAVWKPYAGPVGAADTSGFGAYGTARTSTSGKYPFHGYYIDGSSELDTIASPNGLAWSSDGSTKKGYNNVVPDITGGDFTMLTQFMLRRVTGTQVIFGGFNSDLGTLWQYGFGFVADTTTLRAVCAFNNTSQNVTFSGLAVDTWYTAVFTKKGTTGTLFVNGARSTGTVASSGLHYPLAWFGTGHQPNGFLVMGQGAQTISGEWTRAFSDAEALALSTNPWQLFAPLPRRIFVDVVGGVTNPAGFGTDTLKALTEIATGRAGALTGARDTLRALTESATGVIISPQVGFAAGTLKALTESATGRTGARGIASDTLKALTEQATGFTSVNPVGFATDTLKALTETATGRTGALGSARDTLRAFNEAATGLAGSLGSARDTLRALTENATGTITSNAAQGYAAGTFKALTESATGRTGAIAGARDTFRALTEQAQGRTGMVGFSVDSLKALQAAAGAVSGAEPIAPASRGGAPAWWGYEGNDGTRRPWWYRDLKDKAAELERQRKLRIELGIIKAPESKRIAKVVREVEAFADEIPTPERADEFIARAEALAERVEKLVDQLYEDDDEQTIMEMSRFFFHHRTAPRSAWNHARA